MTWFLFPQQPIDKTGLATETKQDGKSQRRESGAKVRQKQFPGQHSNIVVYI